MNPSVSEDSEQEKFYCTQISSVDMRVLITYNGLKFLRCDILLMERIPYEIYLAFGHALQSSF